MERNQLILNHLFLAKQIALSQFKKTPPHVQLDELQAAAYMGLVQAASKYDGKKPFIKYAPFRIYGEIKDYLRGFYWGGRTKPLSVTSLKSDCEDKEEDCFDEFVEPLSDLGKKVISMRYKEYMTMEEIAEKVNLSKSRVFQLIQENLQTLRQKIGII
jgi:RNA polymerase sigma factor (sigma-70 family)